MLKQKFKGFVVTPHVVWWTGDDGREFTIWGVEVDLRSVREEDLSDLFATTIKFEDDASSDQFITLSSVIGSKVVVCWRDDVDDYTIVELPLSSIMAGPPEPRSLVFEKIRSVHDLEAKLIKSEEVQGRRKIDPAESQ